MRQLSGWALTALSWMLLGGVAARTVFSSSHWGKYILQSSSAQVPSRVQYSNMRLSG